MVNKYLRAVFAGAAFGVLIGIMAAIPCLLVISFVLMVVLGAITVHLARDSIKDSMDAMMASGLAGIVSGVVGFVIAMGGLALLAVLAKTYNYEQISVLEMGRNLGFLSLICGPVLIVAGVLLSAIGGFVYYEMVGKKNA